MNMDKYWCCKHIQRMKHEIQDNYLLVSLYILVGDYMGKTVTLPTHIGVPKIIQV